MGQVLTTRPWSSALCILGDRCVPTAAALFKLF
jgi:hypothetical protein